MSQLDKLPKGRQWEYRVHRAAFVSGWYIRRGTNLRERVHGSPQTMAEVDILGVHFDAALVPRLLVGECKTSKGGAKEADRVVWLLGLRQTLRAQHVLFAKPTIAEGTYSWARSGEVLLWDESAVRDVERRAGLAPQEGYAGSFNPSLSDEAASAVRRLKPTDTPLRRAWDYMSGAFWYTNSATRAKRLPAFLELVQKTPGLPERSRGFLIAEGLLGLLAAALTTAGEFSRVSPARAKVWLTQSFASGVASAAALRDIAARADEFYRDALRQVARQVGAAPALDVPRLANKIAEPPAWLGEFVELARRLAERPQYATDLLRFADIILLERVLGENKAPPGLDSIRSPHAELLQLLQLSAYFVKRVWGVDSKLLEQVIALNGARTEDGPNPSSWVGQQPPLAEVREVRPIQ